MVISLVSYLLALRTWVLMWWGLCSWTASLPFAILTLVNTPYKRGFYCGDDSIRYPYRPDTITHGLMAGVTITATVLLVSAGEAYLVYTDRLYSRSDFNNYVAAVYKVLGTFIFGAAVSQSLTDLAKYMIGRLRPNFLAVCDPDWSRVNCSVYVQLDKVCRGSTANVTEARLLFYSGHSSFGMYCMMFLVVSFSADLLAVEPQPVFSPGSKFHAQYLGVCWDGREAYSSLFRNIGVRGCSFSPGQRMPLYPPCAVLGLDSTWILIGNGHHFSSFPILEKRKCSFLHLLRIRKVRI
uniref:Phosphatidic acid phosphatase type 2/haloperoxidase domain-containing protein n=2 Tax=Castor canadensis TaxID=51338 RepID=A0A8C0XCP1_CASCN